MTQMNPKNKQKIMEKFNDIHIVFSVDAVGNTYDYVRTNAKWDKTKKTIENIFKNNYATHYGFNVVLMPYNIFNLVDLLEWYQELHRANYKFSVFFDTSDVSFTGTSAILPEDLADSLLHIKNFFNNCDNDFKNIDGISDLLKILESTKYSEKYFEEFKLYNNTLDKNRKTSLLQLNERFLKYV